MSIATLGACEWFVWDLRRSNLVDRARLDHVCAEFLEQRPGAEPPALAAHLVEQRLLTGFQAERLQQGKAQPLVVGPYILMDVLGLGSMGTVYRAQSKTDQQWYAIKVLPRRSMWNVRVARRQVRAFEHIKHPAVVPFVDVGTAGGVHYLAWPLIEGESLEGTVARLGQLTPSAAARHVRQAATALDLCHQAGLVHGTIKPSNLMIGEDQQIRILDFGIGSLLAESSDDSLVDTMSTANARISGLDCMAPECILEPNKLSPAADQYALGCVLYFCLTGRYPFPEGTVIDKMMAHQVKQPTSIRELVPGIPAAMVTVVERLMANNPQGRFPSLAHAVEALSPFAEARSGVRMVRRPLENVADPATAVVTAKTVVRQPPTHKATGVIRPTGGQPACSTAATMRTKDVQRPPGTDRSIKPSVGQRAAGALRALAVRADRWRACVAAKVKTALIQRAALLLVMFQVGCTRWPARKMGRLEVRFALRGARLRATFASAIARWRVRAAATFGIRFAQWRARTARTPNALAAPRQARPRPTARALAAQQRTRATAAIKALAAQRWARTAAMLKGPFVRRASRPLFAVLKPTRMPANISSQTRAVVPARSVVVTVARPTTSADAPVRTPSKVQRSCVEAQVGERLGPLVFSAAMLTSVLSLFAWRVMYH